jgi:hypothetical protein
MTDGGYNPGMFQRFLLWLKHVKPNSSVHGSKTQAARRSRQNQP